MGNKQVQKQETKEDLNYSNYSNSPSFFKYSNSREKLTIFFIGASKTGKTLLLLRIAEGTFDEGVSSDFGARLRTKTVNAGGNVVKEELWDTSGQEKYIPEKLIWLFLSLTLQIASQGMARISSEIRSGRGQIFSSWK